MNNCISLITQSILLLYQHQPRVYHCVMKSSALVVLYCNIDYCMINCVYTNCLYNIVYY